MKKIILLTLILFSSIYAFAIGYDNFRYLIPQNNKSQPDTATSITLTQFTNYVPVNSYILCYAGAKCGGGDIDSLYDALLEAVWFEQENNATFNVRNQALADTSFLNMNSGELVFFVENSDTEIVALKLIDPSGAKKSSFYSVYKFVEKADTAVKIGVIEDTVLSPGFGTSFFVTYQDDSEKIFFDYGTIMQDSTMKMTVLNDNNSSVTVASLGENSHDVLYPNIINGGYYISLSDNEVEDFYIVFEPLLSTYPMDAETFHFVSLPNDQSPTYIVISFEGYNQTEGLEKNMLCINMGEDGPVSSNNSSQVQTNLYDLTGDGGTISVSGWQTLTSGVAQFSVNSANTNECLVLENLTQGTPQMNNITKFVGFEYKGIGEGIYGTAYGPKAAAVGDTIVFDARITDAYDNVDVNFNGISKVETSDSDIEFLNMNTLASDSYPEIKNGNTQFMATAGSAGEKIFYFNDSEGDFIHQYFSTRNSFDGQELTVEWLNSTLTSADELKLFLPVNRMARLGWNESVSVAAVFNDSIDMSSSIEVHISASGDAVLSDTLITLDKGTGTFYISDTTSEAVIISVSASGLSDDIDTLKFAENTKAAVLLSAGKDKCVINEASPITFFAMSPTFVCDTAFDGHIELFVSDSNGDSLSLNFVGHPADNIPIIDGIGNVDIYNAEAEQVEINGFAVSGTDTIFLNSMKFNSCYQFIGEANSFVTVGVSDTIMIFASDFDSNTKDYDSKIDEIFIYEENENNSFLYPVIPAGYNIINGECKIGVSQSEDENVDVFGLWSDTFILNSGIETYIMTVSSTNGVVSAFKKNSPDKFSLSSPFPNPMKNSASIKFSLSDSELITATVYDKTGRAVKSMFKGQLSAGSYMLKFDGTDNLGKELPSGMYMFVISSKEGIKGAKSFIKL